MFFLLRQLLKSSASALVGGVIFQFFGGFYSNSEHVDIVRAFAFAPWILYVFTLDVCDQSYLTRRIVLIPLFVYLIATGGYPGNLLSYTFIVGIYFSLQLIDGLAQGSNRIGTSVLAVSVVLFTLLGFGMAMLHLGPIWLYRDQFIRYAEFQLLPRFNLGVEQLPGLFLSNKTLPGEISMTSTYVTLPALLFASFVPLSKLRQYWVLLTVGTISFLMAGGSGSFLWQFISTLIAPLQVSRFPSSDYRVFIAIPLILFCCLGLQALVQKALTTKALFARIGIVGGGVLLGTTSSYQMQGNEVLATVAVAGATLLLVMIFWKDRPDFSGMILLSVIVLISLDALRVLPDMPTWREPAINSYFSTRGWPYETGGNLVVSSIFARHLKSRPSRSMSVDGFFGVGYVDGRYLIDDTPSVLLQAYRIVVSNKHYHEYMLMEWTPLLLDPDLAKEGAEKVFLPESELTDRLKNISPSTEGSVEQIDYDINNVIYSVSLKKARLVVENELYFPGWEARLIFPDRETQLHALVVNQVFRAWLLPAGNYSFEAHFHFPQFWIFQTISFAALAGWLALSGLQLRRRLRA